MIIARSMGSLGNQIFQVAACVSRLGSRESFVGFGFRQFVDVFSVPRTSQLRFTSRFSRGATKIAFGLLEWCAQMRLVGQLCYFDLNGGRQIIRKRGLLPVAVMNAPYPHHESHFDSVKVHRLVFGFDLANLKGFSPRPAGDAPRCFVHIRRGDFLFWPSVEAPAAVPESWFIQEMNKMQARLGNCEFTVLSDDLDGIQGVHNFSGKVSVFRGNYREAFLEMLNCDAGILSPSSFSWWAAWYLTQKKPGFFVAPDFWNNWMLGKWKPGISGSSFLIYSKVGE